MSWGVLLLLVIGGLLSVQAAANVQLSRATSSPLGASTLQLAIGSVVLLAATVALGATGVLGLLADVPIAHLLGGIGSAVYITAGILLFPRLGAVVTTGLFIAGQMLASLVLDSFGLLGVVRAELDWSAAVGVLAVLAGAAAIVQANASVPVRVPSGAPGPQVPSARGARPGRLAFAVLGGAVLPVQGAINARLRADLGAPLAVSAVSFVLATAVMAGLLAAALVAGRTHRPRWTGAALPWWGWLGGVIGAAYVTSVFLLIPELGAAATIALTVAGQQLAGVAVDHFGLLRMARRPVSRYRLTGVVVLLAGVAVLQW
jgi:bacterial/archaeal transporter family-2 protein